MRTHLGCSGQVELGTLSKETQQKLEHVEAAWLEFVPESVSLEVAMSSLTTALRFRRLRGN